jgi:predicted signal transduction protein with EAL and GGDEF domain
LQKFLNTHGFSLVSTGWGSPGNETATFGLHTYAALVNFQPANNLPATGYFGPLTRAISMLRRLKALGVRIVMDDFGTGYSSLSYLHSFPFDKIKIDRLFISDLEHNSQSATIVRAVIGLARGLELPVAAEGLETKGQLAILAHEGCDEIQGYLLGRPHPIESYAKLVGRITMAEQKSALAG